MRTKGVVDAAVTAAQAAEVVRGELLGAVAEAVRAAFGAQASSIALLDAPARELVFAAAAGTGAADLVGARFPAAEGLAGAVLREGRPLAADDLLAETRFAHDIAEETGYVPEAMLIAPVPGPAGPAGVISVLDPGAVGPPPAPPAASPAGQLGGGPAGPLAASPAGQLAGERPEDPRLALLAAFAGQAAAALAVDGSARAMLGALRDLLATRV